ncbi:MAG TPA: MBL fold metallo-hydrolase [Anaerolineales bacterium]|nr:MBL fold metallo-hydrolase [Anaerolineales bacterium]
MNVRLTHIGTATLLLEIGSLRLLTDPVFDPAGGRYSFGYGTGGMKLTDPSIKPEAIGRIDAVLLSHDQHEDNLDRAGRALLPKVRQVITTQAGAKRLGGNALGLKTWQGTTLASNGFQIKVTALPAHHGSLGSHLIVGKTTGFLLEWNGQQNGALYISGDTVWFNGIHEIAGDTKSALPSCISAAQVSRSPDRSVSPSTPWTRSISSARLTCCA